MTRDKNYTLTPVREERSRENVSIQIFPTIDADSFIKEQHFIIARLFSDKYGADYPPDMITQKGDSYTKLASCTLFGVIYYTNVINKIIQLLKTKKAQETFIKIIIAHEIYHSFHFGELDDPDAKEEMAKDGITEENYEFYVNKRAISILVKNQAIRYNDLYLVYKTSQFYDKPVGKSDNWHHFFLGLMCPVDYKDGRYYFYNGECTKSL